MLSLNSNISRVGMMAKAIAGSGTAQARDNVISPRGILQQIKNFFTGDEVRNALIEQYQSLIVVMMEALDGRSLQYTVPGDLTVYYREFRVIFSLPHEHDPQGAVTIEVSRDNEDIFRAEVEQNRYRSICTALLIRYRCNLSSSDQPLTNEGKIDLKSADLHNVDIRGADLQQADLEEANMQDADMRSTNLKGANLRNTKLICAKLQRADLQGADLRGANLRDADLTDANLCNTDLRNAHLINTKLPQANLTRSNLQGTCLNYVTLSLADLEGANLRRSRLHNTSLNEANLRRVDLQGALLDNLHLGGANLTGAVLESISLQNTLLWLPVRWNEEDLDALLNHISTPERGSLLTMMDSIDARYPAIKIKMARQLIASLQSASSLPLVAHALLDVLSKAPWKDQPDIDNWLEKLCMDYLRYHNTHVMPPNPAPVIRYAVRQFHRHQWRMEILSGALIQLVDQGIVAAVSEADSKAITGLYECYLNREKIRPWTALEIFGDYRGKPEWGNCHAENYIMLSSRPDGHVMLISKNTLQGMLAPDPLCPVWDHFYLYNRQMEELPPGMEAPETLFEQHFPLFLAPYQYAQEVACFYKLLSLLNLTDLRKLFLDATRQRVSQVKLVSEEQQLKLKEIFLPVLECSTDYGYYSLKEAHYCQIIEVYDLAGATDTARARMLLCLAAVFTQYTSSAIFGTEYESPEILRFYACALMEQAFALDQGVFNCEERNQFPEWKNRLLGLNNAFSCSTILSSMMINHIKKHFPEVLVGMLPPAWS